jgi:uncharacterized damage-inducible protein DinB
MKAKEILNEQLEATHNESAWFTCGIDALKGLSAPQAAWKPDAGINSIWEILAHINYYNLAYLERFKGIDYQYPKSENSETFEAAEGHTEEAWRAECEKFSEICSGFRELMESSDESKFDSPVSAKRKDPWGSVIAHINIHNAHHIGQIVILRKLQGSWDEKVGVS